MMYIEVESKDVHKEQSQKGNELRSQAVYMHDTRKKYPQEYKLGLGSAPAFEPGKYLLGARSFRPSRFGGMELDAYNIELIPLNDAQCKALGV